MLVQWLCCRGFSSVQNILRRIGSDCCIEFCGILLIAKIILKLLARMSNHWYNDPVAYNTPMYYHRGDHHAITTLYEIL